MEAKRGFHFPNSPLNPLNFLDPGREAAYLGFVWASILAPNLRTSPNAQHSALTQVLASALRRKDS
jgi:hypothetical protein